MRTAATTKSMLSTSARKHFEPRAYQQKSIKFMIERPCAGLFLDPGLGKTIISYSAFEILHEIKAVKCLLVVTLLRPAYEVWPREVEKWGLDLKCVVLHGKDKNKRIRQKADVYVINYDGLPWLERMFPVGLPPFDMVVFDESSKLRNTNTQRFKTVRRILKWFKRRYILTGTPTPKSLMNLWGQIFVLDNGQRLGQYITHFRNKYFSVTLKNEYGPIAFEIKKGAEKQIYDAVKDVVIRFDETELDMPKLVRQDVYVELPPDARRMYDDFERDLIMEVAGDIVTAKNAGVATQKHRQIANGGLYVVDRNGARRTEELHQAKTDAVLEILDELGGKPALISYEFEHDLERLRRALPKDTPWIGGGVSLKRTREILDAWNRGDLEHLLGQPASMAHGLNMQDGPGNVVIYHSLVWDYEAYDQFIRRVRRSGQKAKRVYLYHVVARDTVDQAVLASWQRKGNTQNDFFKALKDYLNTKR